MVGTYLVAGIFGQPSEGVALSVLMSCAVSRVTPSSATPPPRVEEGSGVVILIVPGSTVLLFPAGHVERDPLAHWELAKLQLVVDDRGGTVHLPGELVRRVGPDGRKVELGRVGGACSEKGIIL